MRNDPNSNGRAMWGIAAQESLQSVLDDTECPPLLRQTLTGVLGWQTRNETLVSTALASPRAAPQWVAALLALGAVVIVDGETGPAEVSLEALLQRDVKGEVSAVRVPLGGREQRWGEAHVARTPADEPIVAVIAVVEVGDSSTGPSSGSEGIVLRARIALTGAWQEPVRLAEASGRLEGSPLDTSSIRAVAMAVEEEVEPRKDFLGSEAYRRAMASVLTRRALEQCLHQGAEDA